jgi:hypothetical protein
MSIHAGEKDPPTNPVTPYAGSWPMCDFNLFDHQFYDKKGNLILLVIPTPSKDDSFPYFDEAEYLV